MSGSSLQIPITAISENEMTHAFTHRFRYDTSFIVQTK